MQSVYAASSRSGTNPNNTPEQWKHLYGGGNMIEATNFIFANDSDKLDLDKLPPGWEIALTADCVRYYIDRKTIKNGSFVLSPDKKKIIILFRYFTDN
jgi:hypothetical protein